MIKIGFSKNGIERKNLESTFKRFIQRYHKDAILLLCDDEKYCFEELDKGNEINAVAVYLEDLPSTLPDGLVIAALTKRETCNVCIVTFASKSFSDALFNLPENPIIGYSSEIIAKQFEAILPSANFIKLTNPDEVFQELNYIAQPNLVSKNDLSLSNNAKISEPLNAGLIEQNYLNGNSLIQDEVLENIPFEPDEMTPLAGVGVVAYLVKESDLATRKFFKDIHHIATGELTNIERKLKKMFNDKDIAAHCIKDLNENYHFYAAALVDGHLKRCRISQSTHFELAETAFSKLVAG